LGTEDVCEPSPATSILALTILCLGAAAGCGKWRKPYDTPRARVDGDQAVPLLRREVETQDSRKNLLGGKEGCHSDAFGNLCLAWLVRLISDDRFADRFGYVWRGEEAGRADGTVIRIRYDRDCGHWTDSQRT